MDALGLAGADNLRRIISRHQQVGLIACGHIHRSIQTNWGGTQITVAPGTSYQVHLDLAPEMPPHFILEPPACQIHVFNGQEFITHTSYVNWSEKPIDVSPFMGELWETIKSKMRKS